MDIAKRSFLKKSLSLTAVATTLMPVSSIIASQLANPTVSYKGIAFGTSWSLTLPKSADLSFALNHLVSIIHRIDQVFSPYRQDSELSNFNKFQKQDYFRFSTTATPVIEIALQQARQTNGIFDPTVGPAVNRWGYSPIVGSIKSSYLDIDIRSVNNSLLVRKSDQKTTLDFCGIAKGFAVQEMVDTLKQLGYHDFFLELGGEVRAVGLHPSGRKWRVGVEMPISATQENNSNSVHEFLGNELASDVYCVIDLDHRAVATSGILHNAYKVKDQLYHHVINTRSGRPSVNHILSVSVMHENATWADCWSTSLMATSYSKARSLIKQHNLSVLLLLAQDNSIRRETYGSVTINQG